MGGRRRPRSSPTSSRRFHFLHSGSTDTTPRLFGALILAAAVLYYASTSEVAWLFLLAYWIFALVVASLIYALWNRGFSSILTVVGTESGTGSPMEELPEQLLGSGPRVPVFEGDRMSVQLRIKPRHGTRGPARIFGSVGGTDLTAAAAKTPDLKLAISADKAAPFGQIVKVMDAAKAAGIKIVNAFTKEAGKP